MTPALQRAAQRIYGGVDEVMPAYDDEELEVVLRFQRLAREWLAERLARAEKRAKRKKR